jgi:hypothetical protein
MAHVASLSLLSQLTTYSYSEMRISVQDPFFHSRLTKLNEEIDAWLAQNPNIEVVSHAQSQDNSALLKVSIIYIDHGNNTQTGPYKDL